METLSKTMHIEGLGNRNPCTEHEEIIWFFEQALKRCKKAQVTRFWLDLKASWKQTLLDRQAYELLDYINSKVTPKQEKDREKRRAIAEYNNKIKCKTEWEELKKMNDEWKARKAVIGDYLSNVN